MNLTCEIYKSKKNEELYLYVEQSERFDRVPPSLLDQINQEKIIMTVMLSPERKLARADVEKVLLEIQEKGFYLQMPPQAHQPADDND